LVQSGVSPIILSQLSSTLFMKLAPIPPLVLLSPFLLNPISSKLRCTSAIQDANPAILNQFNSTAKEVWVHAYAVNRVSLLKNILRVGLVTGLDDLILWSS